jgi:hypothetical protein
MFITVLAIICLNLAAPGTCMNEPVVNSNQEQLTMGGCLGLLGFESAKDFWEHHPLHHTWKSRAGPVSSAMALRLAEAKLNG